MEYKLKRPISVYSKDEGDYIEVDEVKVSFKGKKGLKTIKRLQDVIFKSFQNATTSTEVKQETADKDVTIDEVFDMLEMMGTSEKLFEEVTGALKAFATIGGKPLDDKLQDEMDIDDLDNLYREVLKTFLLPKITSKLNSMKK